MDYDNRQQVEEKIEDFLLDYLEREPHNIELIKTYSAYKTAYELENIRGILWDIKNLLVKGQ